jgi:hypothetical protein
MSNLPREVLEAMKEEARRTGRLGGLTRAKNMTAEQRRKGALKASKAAAASRREIAKLRKVAAKLKGDTDKMVREHAPKHAEIKRLLKIAKGKP